MQFTRSRDLVIAAVAGLAAGYVVFDLAYGSLPRLPITAGATLLVLAGVELVLAGWVRSRISNRRLTEPVLVSRFVALAKASSLLGALMLGGWLGALGYLLVRAGRLEQAAQDIPSAVTGAVCAAGLIGAALWLEHSCRTPERPESDRADRQGES